ncbi:hypothetical protein PIROE2DRAFT_62906 [Piromyces sp. E2]|nr:hypothetical protein PIROE2DRAFT_62906 [Piromyces sp. E2]|eukprot:OUM60822.1 hypothetical protein PIROE2DRAFT_62906 [Piromyces sp. E2]
MSTISEPLFVSTTNLRQNQYSFDGCYYDNQGYTDYPSPMSSPNSPDLSEISGNNSDCGNNCHCSYFTNVYDYCPSPLSPASNDDIDIDIDIDTNTTSQGSYTTMNQYTNTNTTNNSLYSDCSVSKKSRKRSYSEVEDVDIFSDIDCMNEDEIDNYLNNIDLDLFPRVKSSSELLIFSPLAMKRFKLSNNKKSMLNENNYNCFESINNNTPQIVEITDEEEEDNQYTSSEESMSSLSSNASSISSSSSSSNIFCSCSPIIS